MVPRLVALKAAPAAKDWRDVADTSSLRMNDKPIGTQIPVMATAVDRRMFAFKDFIEVERPPVYCKNLYPAIIKEIAQTYLRISRVSDLDTPSAGSLFLSLD